MIYALRKKFFLIAALSLGIVFVTIFIFFNVSNYRELNDMMDGYTDAISRNNGSFPQFRPKGEPGPEQNDYITPESQFSTRFFTVTIASNGYVIRTDMAMISSVSEEEALEYATTVIEKGDERGWVSDFRYKLEQTDTGYFTVFVDGSVNKLIFQKNIFASGMVLIVVGVGVLLLIFFLSARAVRPAAQSYERQKQFITDASHELKTPITLILTNVDIAESELGKNEWLDDIRSEGKSMTGLVNRLIALARMNEMEDLEKKEPLDIGELLLDVASEFNSKASLRDLVVETDINKGAICKCSPATIRQIFSALMDNAVKYCDAKGKIRISLEGGLHPTIYFENTFADVDNVEFSKLFDRFYRSDKARTAGSGYGIGLSMAMEGILRQNGTISAYKKNENTICFKIVLK